LVPKPVTSIVIGMKFKMTALLALVTCLVSEFAIAQNQASTEKSDPLVLVQIAANLAGNSQHQNLDGYIAIYVDAEKWEAGLKDGDLGPFLKVKDKKAGRSAVFFFSQSKDTAIVVYFDGGTAFGMTAVKASASGKIEASDISAGYEAVTEEMLKANGQKFHFEAAPINTDDGESLTAYVITKK
jgi:hypothetical protein